MTRPFPATRAMKFAIAGVLLALMAYQHFRVHDTPPRPAWVITADEGCIFPAFGLSEAGTLLGLPARIRLPDGSAPRWLTPLEQCRLVVAEEAAWIQVVRRNDPVGAQGEERYDVPALGCGALETLATADGHPLWAISGCGTALAIDTNRVMTWRGETLIDTEWNYRSLHSSGVAGTTTVVTTQRWDAKTLAAYLDADEVNGRPDWGLPPLGRL